MSQPPPIPGGGRSRAMPAAAPFPIPPVPVAPHRQSVSPMNALTPPPEPASLSGQPNEIPAIPATSAPGQASDAVVDMGLSSLGVGALVVSLLLIATGFVMYVAPSGFFSSIGDQIASIGGSETSGSKEGPTSDAGDVASQAVLVDGGSIAMATDNVDAGREESKREDRLRGRSRRENGEIDRPNELISLTIKSEPSGASVVRERDGVLLGRTPYRYEVESAPGRTAFTLKKKGFRSVTLTMPSNRDGIRQMILYEKRPQSIGATARSKNVDPNRNVSRPLVSKPKRARRAAARKIGRSRKGPARDTPKPSTSEQRVDYDPDQIPLD